MAGDLHVPTLKHKQFIDSIGDAEYQLYRLSHLCRFINEVAEGTGASRQEALMTNDIHTESIEVVFGFIKDEIDAARNLIEAGRDAIHSCSADALPRPKQGISSGAD